MIRMKRIIFRLIVSACLASLLPGCNQDLPVYENPDCLLSFVYYDYYDKDELADADDVTDVHRTSYYSFAYGEDARERDTLWFEVRTAGFLSAEARPVALQQIEVEGEENAVPGVHYVAFDAPELQSLYSVPAYQNRLEIPVVLLRDASLKTKTVTLKFAFRDNGVFQPGYEGLEWRVIYATDHLSKPGNYDSQYLNYYFGEYTEKKHELMNRWTKRIWDEEYINEITSNFSYVLWLSEWFVLQLEEENARLQENGEDILREPDGTPVSFKGVYN